jgi:predicted nucleic acid-binding protein
VSRRIFLDSNILVYAVSADPRAQRAQAALRKGHVISVQVLNEFCNVARRKLARDMAEIRQACAGFRSLLEVVPLTLATHDAALDLCERRGFSFYDALIVAAALHAQCDALYSEDLQHGQVIERQLRIVNPFA